MKSRKLTKILVGLIGISSILYSTRANAGKLQIKAYSEDVVNSSVVVVKDNASNGPSHQDAQPSSLEIYYTDSSSNEWSGVGINSSVPTTLVFQVNANGVSSDFDFSLVFNYLESYDGKRAITSKMQTMMGENKIIDVCKEIENGIEYEGVKYAMIDFTNTISGFTNGIPFATCTVNLSPVQTNFYITDISLNGTNGVDFETEILPGSVLSSNNILYLDDLLKDWTNTIPNSEGYVETNEEVVVTNNEIYIKPTSNNFAQLQKVSYTNVPANSSLLSYRFKTKINTEEQTNGVSPSSSSQPKTITLSDSDYQITDEPSIDQTIQHIEPTVIQEPTIDQETQTYVLTYNSRTNTFNAYTKKETQLETMVQKEVIGMVPTAEPDTYKANINRVDKAEISI